jgi:glycosyltransferase involved in cell wall biosynthesis
MDVNCPKISVLMSVYNEPESIILESVNSILTQTFSDFELLIVNDNPQNHEVEAILERIAKMDSRIRIIKNERNVGLAISLNRAADVAKANYFLRMDSDDVSMPNRFEKRI